MQRRAAEAPRKLTPKGESTRGRRPKRRAATVRRKNLRLDQAKLDLLRRSLGVATDQEAVERVIDEAVADRELIDATLALGGVLPELDALGERE